MGMNDTAESNRRALDLLSGVIRGGKHAGEALAILKEDLENGTCGTEQGRSLFRDGLSMTFLWEGGVPAAWPPPVPIDPPPEGIRNGEWAQSHLDLYGHHTMVIFNPKPDDPTYWTFFTWRSAMNQTPLTPQ